jgi:hypothetical protein
MTNRANSREKTEFVRCYRVEHSIVHQDAQLVRIFSVGLNFTRIDVMNLDDLTDEPGKLFAYISTCNIFWSQILWVHYYKICGNLIYSYQDTTENPIRKVVQPLGNNLAPNKIKTLHIAKDSFDLVIEENGIPPLCHLTPEAHKYEVGFDQNL